MYERYSDRARKLMQLANQEAQRFNHEYIGTEHLLLGLVKEGTGVAAHVLKNFDVDLRKVRLEVEKIVQAGPDKVTMGKLPQTPRTKKVIEYAIDEARRLNHNYLGTEHVLLGLLREQEGVAAQVLTNLGLSLDGVRRETMNLLGQRLDIEEASQRLTERAWKALEMAEQEARRLNHDCVGTEHLLLALMKESVLAASTPGNPGVASQALQYLDIDPRDVVLILERNLGMGQEPATIAELPRAPRLRMAIDSACIEAGRLKQGRIGTGLLLMGLLRDDELASQIVKSTRVLAHDLRAVIQALLLHEPLPPRPAKLPDDLLAELTEIDAQIERLNGEKEEAVACQDFEKAAHLRDQADRLKTRKDKLLAKHAGDSSSSSG